jgi:hypothetical protein
VHQQNKIFKFVLNNEGKEEIPYACIEKPFIFLGVISQVNVWFETI